MSDKHFPVVIVGAGPTGLILTHLLARSGVRVLLIDRAQSTVGEARAVTIDDESLRTLQATGMLPEVIGSITQGYGVHYYSWKNELFARIDPTSREHGYDKRNAMRQEVLVRQLCDGLARWPNVELRFQHELKSFDQDADGVTLRIAAPSGEQDFRCDWFVACDGGRSTVREQLGISLDGDTYAEKWLIADLLDRTTPFRHTRTYCDPIRPAIRLPGPQGVVRYEFMLHKGEDADAVLDEGQIRDWIRQREPLDAVLPLARKVVYTFHARVAQRWRDGRIFLAGDAAHLTPPFAGQGMNSGVRDATNLAWKLAAVVNKQLPAGVLDTYEQERKPHAWALIQMALRIGKFMQPKSRMGAAFNQAALRMACLIPAARDYILQLKFKPKPRFVKGLFQPDGAGSPLLPAGQLLPQPLVETTDRKLTLLDEVLGSGFCVIEFADAPPTQAPAELKARRIRLLRRSEDFLPVHLCDGATVVRDWEDKLAPLLDSARAHAVVLRPDRYVFAFIPATEASPNQQKRLFEPLAVAPQAA